MACSLQLRHATCPALTRRAFFRGCQRPFNNRCKTTAPVARLPLQRVICRCTHGCKSQQHAQQAHSQPWAYIAALLPLAISQSSLANEATDTAKDVTTAAASAASDFTSSQPTITFGQSFGSYDPVIGVFFYLVIAALSVLTLGVSNRQ